MGEKVFFKQDLTRLPSKEPQMAADKEAIDSPLTHH